MKRTITVAIILGLLAGALAAPAEAQRKKKKPKKIERVVEVIYDNPAIGTANVGGGCFGCPSVAAGKREIYVMVEVEDDLAPTTGVSFSWDTTGDGIADTGFEVCGATEEPVEIPGSVEMIAFPWIAPSTHCPNGFATSGKITVTLSNRP